MTQIKDRIKKERFIEYELYALLNGIDSNIGNVTAYVDINCNDVTQVCVKYFDGREVKVNVECDSLPAIVIDVVRKLFY